MPVTSKDRQFVFSTADCRRRLFGECPHTKEKMHISVNFLVIALCIATGADAFATSGMKGLPALRRAPATCRRHCTASLKVREFRMGNPRSHAGNSGSEASECLWCEGGPAIIWPRHRELDSALRRLANLQPSYLSVVVGGFVGGGGKTSSETQDFLPLCWPCLGHNLADANHDCRCNKARHQRRMKRPRWGTRCMMRCCLDIALMTGARASENELTLPMVDASACRQRKRRRMPFLEP